MVTTTPAPNRPDDARVVATSQSYCRILRDEAGLTAIVDEAVFKQHEMSEISRQAIGPLKMVSTDGELPFDVVGFLQPLLLELNRAGVKAGPQGLREHPA